GARKGPGGAGRAACLGPAGKPSSHGAGQPGAGGPALFAPVAEGGERPPGTGGGPGKTGDPVCLFSRPEPRTRRSPGRLPGFAGGAGNEGQGKRASLPGSGGGTRAAGASPGG